MKQQGFVIRSTGVGRRAEWRHLVASFLALYKRGGGRERERVASRESSRTQSYSSAFFVHEICLFLSFLLLFSVFLDFFMVFQFRFQSFFAPHLIPEIAKKSQEASLRQGCAYKVLLFGRHFFETFFSCQNFTAMMDKVKNFITNLTVQFLGSYLITFKSCDKFEV